MGESAPAPVELIVGDEANGFRVAPSRGGMVTALWLDATPVLYLDRATLNDPSSSVRGGIPVLFPICGPLRDNRYEVGGHVYDMRQHGFARSLPWNVAAHTLDRVTLTLASSEQTLPSYPFAFEVRCTYAVTPGRLRIEHAVENRSATPMPFSFGFHPYFLTTDKRALRFTIPAAHAAQNPFGPPEPFHGLDAVGQTVDLTFTDPTHAVASFDDLSAGHRITVRGSEAYRYLVFWTLPDRPFCCLEPWTARGDALNTQRDLTHLAAGQQVSMHVEIIREPLHG